MAPASALATTVTATGDDSNPVPLSTATTVALRNMDVAADVSVPQADAVTYRTQVVDQAGTPASDPSPCRGTEFGSTWTNYARSTPGSR